MNYINRLLDYCSPSQHWQLLPAPNSTQSSEQQSLPLQNRHRKHRHRVKNMTCFNGPWSPDLESFEKSIKSMPDRYTSSFVSGSKDTLEKLCNPDWLHVWESDSDIDNLLQLSSVIAKLCDRGSNKDKRPSIKNGRMLIIAEENAERDNFSRICKLVEHLTNADGKRHLEGSVAAFGGIIVVKGWNNAYRRDDVRSHVDQEPIYKRINTSLERSLKMGSEKKMVWHQGPSVHSLLHWINSTSSSLRNALEAVTVTGSLDLSEGVKPSRAGRTNTLSDLQRLESYAKKLDVPVVFLDTATQLVSCTHLATYMYYYAYYINTFLPPSVARPHLYKAQDELVTFAFQLLGASKGKYGDSVVKQVKQHLSPSLARKWARSCIDPNSYSKPNCKASTKDSAINHAVHLADGPFARFSTTETMTAFARLSVGPAAVGFKEYHTASPVSIDFSRGRIRPLYPSVMHIMRPAPTQTLENVTNHIQGLMMAVLERVRQSKGNPEISAEQKGMWKDVVKACEWAMDASMGRMSSGVKEKVGFVREKLRKGTWGFAVGVGDGQGVKGGAGGISDAARANEAANQAYGEAQRMGRQLYAGQYEQHGEMGGYGMGMGQQGGGGGGGYGQTMGGSAWY